MSRAGAPETSSQPSRGRAARSSDAQHSFQVTFSAHCIVLCPGVVRVENIVSAASRASRSSSTLPPAMSQASARLRIVVAPPNLVTYSLALAHENQGHPERIGLTGSSGDSPTAYQTYKTNSQPRALLTRPTSSTRSSAGKHFGVPTAGKAELTSGARATTRSAWIQQAAPLGDPREPSRVARRSWVARAASSRPSESPRNFWGLRRPGRG